MAAGLIQQRNQVHYFYYNWFYVTYCLKVQYIPSIHCVDRLLWRLLYSCDFNILVFLDFIYAINFTLLHYQIFVIFSIIILLYLSLSFFIKCYYHYHYYYHYYCFFITTHVSSNVIICVNLFQIIITIIVIITTFVIVINFTITVVIIFTINCYQKFLFMFIAIIINSTTAISFIISCFINRSERQVYSITLFDSPPQWLCDNKLVEHSLVHWYQQCVTAHRVPKCMSCHKAIAVITGRTHCFHDYMCTTPTLLLRDLSTLRVVEHLWPFILCSLLSLLSTLWFIGTSNV